MILKDYKKEDGDIISSWLRSEEELYKWSSDRFNKYPLTGDDIYENYAPQLETKRFYPLTAIDEDDNIIGHLIIRYPREDDNNSVRFGFVIVSPEYRGKGYGKMMLNLAKEYVRDNKLATRIDLGVFANNDSAKHCYEAVGFKEYSKRNCELAVGNWECIDMELLL